MLKNLKDFKNEQHHHPTKWLKKFLFGAVVGVQFGAWYTVLAPINSFVAQKLTAAIGERSFSGTYYR